MIPATRRVHLVISGTVQGVGYRAWFETEARSRSLWGWVRNREDGCVEAVVEGPDGAVAALVAACRQGPRAARVDDVVAAEWKQSVKPGFVVRETA